VVLEEYPLVTLVLKAVIQYFPVSLLKVVVVEVVMKTQLGMVLMAVLEVVLVVLKVHRKESEALVQLDKVMTVVML
jgi:hypothetical protein